MPRIEPKWEFTRLEPGQPERDPHEAEFFHLTNPAEAVVREFIQNSLDARRPGESCVKISFSFGEVEKSKVTAYLESLEEHLQAVNMIPVSHSVRIPFLTVEDFGTSGLDGATGEDRTSPPKGNNFYDFWMREGMSGKGGQEGGRWGLGKTTFHAASDIRSFWGLTIRQDDHRELLMGKGMLKTHKIDGQVYDYDGYFRGDDRKPISERRAIEDFKQRFSLARDGENGLSLVIPLPNSEITFSSVLKAVIAHYFYAIMRGVLQVRFQKSDNLLDLTMDNIMQIAELQEWEGTSWHKTNVKELLQFIRDTLSVDPSNYIAPIKIGDKKRDLNSESFGDELTGLMDRFAKGDLLSFRIPIIIQRKTGQSCETHFNVHLRRDPRLKQAVEFYFRSGIMLPKIKTLYSRPVRGLLLAEEQNITEFLGDAEPPAHTEWNERTGGFKDKYEDAARKLRFVANSVRNIYSILDNPRQQRLEGLLKDIFNVPEPTPKKETAIKKHTDVNVGTREPQAFEISMRKEGGFKVSLNKSSKISFPFRARVTMAYDIRRGSPFSRYRPYDFDLATSEKPPQISGGTLLKAERNIIEVEIAKSDFNLEVSGFDPRRDLVIKVVRLRRDESDETQV